MEMFARQMGQPRPRLYTSSAQDEQKRRCPHGTRAMLLSRGATKQTSQSSPPSPSVGLLSAAAVAAAVASDTAALSASASSFSESEFSAICRLSVCAPMLWLTARKNCDGDNPRWQCFTISTPALWCRVFRSRLFSVPVWDLEIYGSHP